MVPDSDSNSPETSQGPPLLSPEAPQSGEFDAPVVDFKTARPPMSISGPCPIEEGSE